MCDKTTSWGIATYLHLPSKRPEDHVSLLRFNPVDNERQDRNSSYTAYKWHYEGAASEAKSGPEEDELMNLEASGSVPSRNQCTFIRSLTPAFGDGDWKDIELRVESLMKDQASAGSPKSPFPSIPGSTGSLAGALSPASPNCGHCNSHHFQQGRIRFLSGHGHGGGDRFNNPCTGQRFWLYHTPFQMFTILKTTAAHPATYVIDMMLRKVPLITTYKP